METYVLDTNILRYKSSTNNDKEDKELRILANQLFQQVQPKVDANEIVWVVPQEVKNELEVHFFGLKAKEVKKIKKSLESINLVVADTTTREMEHHIRIITSYVKQKFQQDFAIHNLKIDYPGVSDVRIMMTAYDVEDSVCLVTHNVKDFIILLLLKEYDSIKIRSLKQDKIKIPLELYEKIHNDETFQIYLNKFFDILERMDENSNNLEITDGNPNNIERMDENFNNSKPIEVSPNIFFILLPKRKEENP